MKKAILLTTIALTLFFAASAAYSAGSSVTFNNIDVYENGALSKTSYLEVTWASDDSTGAAAGTTTADLNAWLAGKIIIGADTRPSATAAPDDNYDIELLELAAAADTTGIDIMGPTTHPLHDRDTSTWEATVPEATTATTGTMQSLVAFKDKYYRFSATNAGNSKGGTCTFTLRR